jgi:CubicO group peptidase (beta-lactamase class C family)
LTPLPPLFAPGSSYKYHDPAVHLLGYILTQVAGESLKSIFKRKIADPIGMTNWDWTDYGIKDKIVFNNPSGIYGGGILITAKELARFGLLYLNRGDWDGKRLIDPNWVNQATSTQVPVSMKTKYFDLTGRYGFMWWTNGHRMNGDGDGCLPWPSAPPMTYAAHGAGRNFCFVIPEWNMVIVRMDNSFRIARTKQDKLWNRFFRILAQGIYMCNPTD